MDNRLHLPPAGRYAIPPQRTPQWKPLLRAICLSGGLLMGSLAFNMALQRGWLDKFPDWFVLVLAVLSLIPLGYWTISSICLPA
jgi:hypothetical protein